MNGTADDSPPGLATAQLFSPGADALCRLVLLTAAACLVALPVPGAGLVRSDDAIGVGVAPSQLVPCMHCEAASSERGGPVDATLHDSEGLNLPVYNRCVGTACQGACPTRAIAFGTIADPRSRVGAELAPAGREG